MRVRPVPTSAIRPRGTGLTSDRARVAMIDGLRDGGIRDAQVLNAMTIVDRHRFVEPGLASRAYEDMSLPIGEGQTISRPFTVARMIELVAEVYTPAERRSARVLEVGTGCGYQAAVLAQVFGEVISIERIRLLHELARANLRHLRQPNLRLVLGDGHLGSPEAAPFQAIVVAAAGASIPDALLLQTALGGRLIAPIQSPNGQQSLHFVERALPAEWRLSVLDSVHFVPMRAGII
jgi:protein-L-isoaspartate(D-aspartate) O-methyltransferase